MLCHHSNLCCVCTDIFGDQAINFMNVWTSTWGWISLKVAHRSLPLLNPSILIKKRYAAGHCLKWYYLNSCSVKLLFFFFFFFFLFVKVSIIEELVVGYESSLKSCRMFTEKGEYFCLLSLNLFFFVVVLFCFLCIWRNTNPKWSDQSDIFFNVYLQMMGRRSPPPPCCGSNIS